MQEEDTEDMAGPALAPEPVQHFSQWADVEDAELDTGVDEVENAHNGK